MKIRDLELITRHPLNQGKKVSSILRYLSFGLRNKFTAKPFVYQFVHPVKIWVSAQSTSAMLQYYNGLNDWEEMAFLLHFLTADDLFVDVGANIGVYSVLAAGARKAKTVAVEPGEIALSALQANVELNNLNNSVAIESVALGKEAGVVSFTRNLDAINRVQRAEDKNAETVDVPLKTLDMLLEDRQPALLKIDVEGFELNVLQGAEETLKKDTLKAVLIETNGLAEKYDLDEKAVHQILLDHGFERFSYEPFSRKLSPIDRNMRLDNSLYLRDIGSINKRIETAPKFRVRNRQI